jgi:hypothetical protein
MIGWTRNKCIDERMIVAAYTKMPSIWLSPERRSLTGSGCVRSGQLTRLNNSKRMRRWGSTPDLDRGSCRSAPLSCPGYALTPKIAQDFASGIVARRASDAASRMSSRATQIEPLDWTPIIRVAQHRTRREHLPQIERSMEYIAADEAECSFEIERG